MSTTDNSDGVRNRIVYPVALIMALCLNGISLAAVFFLREYRNATAGEIGVFTALDWLGYGVACHLVRPRFRRLPAVDAIAAAMAFSALWVYLVTQVVSMPVLMALSLAKGVTMSLFWPVIMGWMTHGLEGAVLNKALGRFNLAWSTGLIVGPMLAGLLCDLDASLAMNLGAFGMAATAAGVMLAVICRPAARAQLSGGATAIGTGDDGGSHLRWPAWAGLFMGFLSLGVMLTAFPLAGKEQLGLSRSIIGFLFLQRSLTMTAGFILLAWFGFWHFRRWPMVVSVLGLAGLTMMLVWAETLTSLLWIFGAMGLLMALVYNASIFHGAAGSADRTGRMAIHESLLAAGYVAGSAVGGQMYEQWGADRVWWITAGLLAVSAMAVLAVGRPRPMPAA